MIVAYVCCDNDEALIVEVHVYLKRNVAIFFEINRERNHCVTEAQLQSSLRFSRNEFLGVNLRKNENQD